MARNTNKILTHEQVWNALDLLAENHDMSASGLAKAAGLDPTTFNKSKRITADGRERWPSTESVSKALAASNSSIDTFVQLIGDGARSLQSVPLLALTQAGSGGHFDDSGFPSGKGWDEVALPWASDEHAYALEISGDSMRPTYRPWRGASIPNRNASRTGASRRSFPIGSSIRLIARD